MEDQRRIARTEAMILAGLTLAGAALRFYRLGEVPLWYDEAVIYHIVQGGWLDILSSNAADNSAPPLYALMLGLLTGPAASEAVLRSLGAAASVAAIPLGYLLAREFLSSRIALLVPVLIAIAPIQLAYAQQLREYSLGVTIATAMLLVYARFIRLPSTRNAVLVASVAVLAMLTQYGLGLMLAALNIVVVVTFIMNRRASADYVRWVLSQLPAAVTAGVIFATVARYQMPYVNLAATVGYLEPYHWDGTAMGFYELLASPLHNIISYAFPGILMLILVAIGAIAFVGSAEFALAAAFFVAPIALTFFMAVLGIYPYGAIRQDLFLTPMIYVIAVVGLQRIAALIPRSWPAFLMPAVVAALSIALVVPGLRMCLGFFERQAIPVGEQSMRAMITTLPDRMLPNDVIYVYINAIPAFRYYWRSRTEPWIAGAPHNSYMDRREAEEQMKNVMAELRKLLASGQRTWVVLSHLSDEDRDQIGFFLKRSGRMHIVAKGPGNLLLLINDPLVLIKDYPLDDSPAA